MADVAIEFEDVSKKFRLGQRFDSIRDLIPGLAKWLTPGQRLASEQLGKREFWALRDVSFEVNRGEALGIIGPNGAGKSTALKILTGILRPTIGRARVRGRLSALIEVGAGFHPDLTGRENVFLNGAILGMSRREIADRFDEIVAFAGLDQFIDTPVKRYSSGMYARLGFSVAVHVDPDVLLVDEVLSVGDMAFQAKCQQKMQDIARSGATIIFVSHNLPAVASLCGRTVLLQAGRVLMAGPTVEAIRRYFDLAESSAPSDDRAVILEETQVYDAGGHISRSIRCGEQFQVVLGFRAAESVEKAAVGLWVRNLKGENVFNVSTQRLHLPPFDLAGGERARVTFTLAANLCAGSYLIGVSVKRYDIEQLYLEAEPVAHLEVVGADDSGGTAWLSPICDVSLTHAPPMLSATETARL